MIKLSERPFIASDNVEPEVETEIDIDFDFELSEAEAEPGATAGADSIEQATVDFFSPGGALLTAAELNGRACEFRPQQLAMGRAIAAALVSGRNLAVEAPTGVGKSFAYLAPLVFRSRGAGRPALVSTETISLQEQLMHKDIPLLRAITGIDFKAALAKGRSNYLCRRRFHLVNSDLGNSLLPLPSLALELERLAKWEDGTPDGERDGVGFRVDPALWQLVCCEAGNCAGPKCSFFRGCFYFRARQEWDSADIVVANHALFFTDLAMRGAGETGGLLPNYGAAVIDEAHTLEDNAAEYLGLDISRAGLNGMLNRLFNPDSARGLLLRSGNKALELRQIVAELRDSVHAFFIPFEQFLREADANARDGGDGGARRIRDTGNFVDTLSDRLMALYRKLADYVAEENDEAFTAELQAQLGRCKEAIDGIRAFLTMSVPDAVYYAEFERNSISLKAAPLNVADLLHRVLFHQDFPVILSSATLTVRHSFDFFCSRVGFDHGDTLLLDSPFDREQAQVFIERAMPDPAHRDYAGALIAAIPKYIEKTGGKAFVLFTSYASLRHSAEALKPYFEAKGITLLVQGGELTRSMMLKTFREDVDSVLFGTDSFWTGVDVPGEALSNVIVAKLPFPSPGHPLVAARNEKIDLAGGSSFRDYTLPAAVLKFRQGVGRLIRSRNDRGIIVILDSRVITKGYGKSFLDSLPYPLVIERAPA